MKGLVWGIAAASFCFVAATGAVGQGESLQERVNRLSRYPDGFRTVTIFPTALDFCLPEHRDRYLIRLSEEAEIAASNLEIAARYRREVAELVQHYHEQVWEIPKWLGDSQRRAEQQHQRTLEHLRETDEARRLSTGAPIVDCHPARIASLRNEWARQDAASGDPFSIFSETEPGEKIPGVVAQIPDSPRDAGSGVSDHVATSPWDGATLSMSRSPWDTVSSTDSSSRQMPGSPVTEVDLNTARNFEWHHSAAMLSDGDLIYCRPYPARNTAGVYGTDLYSIHSVPCRAAVHAGVISFDGGYFRVRVYPEADIEWEGSERNGIVSGGGTGRERSFRVFAVN